MIRHGPTFRSLFALLIAAVFQSACGDREPPPPPEAPAPLGVYGASPDAQQGTPSVVVLDAAGAAGTAAAGEEEAQPTIDQLGLVFTPTKLVARLGEPVLFTNSETIVHNVRLTFADNDSTVFDVETDPGASAEFVFDRAGGYDVTCDHHPGMRAFIFVTDADRAVFADNAGSFVIPDVPPGEYTLSLWTVDPTLRAERQIRVEGPSTEVNLRP